MTKRHSGTGTSVSRAELPIFFTRLTNNPMIPLTSADELPFLGSFKNLHEMHT
jgi:hypothetical protein